MFPGFRGTECEIDLYTIFPRVCGTKCYNRSGCHGDSTSIVSICHNIGQRLLSTPTLYLLLAFFLQGTGNTSYNHTMNPGNNSLLLTFLHSDLQRDDCLRNLVPLYWKTGTYGYLKISDLPNINEAFHNSSIFKYYTIFKLIKFYLLPFDIYYTIYIYIEIYIILITIYVFFHYGRVSIWASL